MRIDSSLTNHLHWHEGTTCHGFPSIQECADHAIKNGWIGKILEQTDLYHVGGEVVKCYSLIISSYAHWAKRGKFVAQTKITLVIEDANVQIT